jgi:hypothetical protein
VPDAKEAVTSSPQSCGRRSPRRWERPASVQGAEPRQLTSVTRQIGRVLPGPSRWTPRAKWPLGVHRGKPPTGLALDWPGRDSDERINGETARRCPSRPARWREWHRGTSFPIDGEAEDLFARNFCHSRRLAPIVSERNQQAGFATNTDLVSSHLRLNLYRHPCSIFATTMHMPV